MSQPHGFFITGTDTGVGKSEVTAALAALLHRQGVTLHPRKPIESGCLPNTQGEPLFPQDGNTLRVASNTNDALETITPYRFEPAISPELAARSSGTAVSLEQLISASTPSNTTGSWLVEGAGGFYSPIAEGALNADLATALGLPVILVTEDRLGAINQVLLARHAILSQGLTLTAIVLNRHQQPDNGNLQSIASRVTEPVIALPSQSGEFPWQTLSTTLEPHLSLFQPTPN